MQSVKTINKKGKKGYLYEKVHRKKNSGIGSNASDYFAFAVLYAAVHAGLTVQ